MQELERSMSSMLVKFFCYSNKKKKQMILKIYWSNDSLMAIVSVRNCVIRIRFRPFSCETVLIIKAISGLTKSFHNSFRVVCFGLQQVANSFFAWFQKSVTKTRFSFVIFFTTNEPQVKPVWIHCFILFYFFQSWVVEKWLVWEFKTILFSWFDSSD